MDTTVDKAADDDRSRQAMAYWVRVELRVMAARARVGSRLAGLYVEADALRLASRPQ